MNYYVVRKDREDGYGGVLIAFKKNFIFEAITVKQNVECQFLKIQLSKSLLIGCINRPPKSNIDYARELQEAIRSVMKNNRSSVLWLSGDFNLPDIDWEANNITGSQNSKQINEIYMDIIAENFREQMVNFPTRGTNILDLFTTNRPSLVNRCQPLPGLGDHDIVFIDSDITAKRTKQTQRKIYLWKKANLKEISTAALDFQKEIADKYSVTDSIQQMWTDIKTNIIKMIDSYVPTKKSTKRFNQPWITTEVKRKARQNKRSYNKARKTNDPNVHARYRKIKYMTKRHVRKHTQST
jgi:hypothetical protein